MISIWQIALSYRLQDGSSLVKNELGKFYLGITQGFRILVGSCEEVISPGECSSRNGYHNACTAYGHIHHSSQSEPYTLDNLLSFSVSTLHILCPHYRSLFSPM